MRVCLVAILLLAGCGPPAEQPPPAGALMTKDEALKLMDQRAAEQPSPTADPTSTATGDAIANEQRQEAMERRLDDLERAQPTPSEQMTIDQGGTPLN